MLNALAVTLVAPAVIWPHFIHADWRKALPWLPALIPAGIAAVRGQSFEGAFAFIVLTALIVGPRPRLNRWSAAAVLALALLILLDFGPDRPRGFLFKNAMTAGQAMAFFTILLDWPWLAAVAGFTGTRSTLFILAWALCPSWRYFVALAAAVFGLLIWALLAKTGNAPAGGIVFDRLDVAGSTTLRGSLNAEWWQGWLGSGYGSFPELQRPHNAVLSLWAQAGSLTIPILLTALWHARRMHILDVLPLLPALWFADWLFSTAGGIGMLGVYVALAQEKRARPDDEAEAVGDEPREGSLEWCVRGRFIERLRQHRLEGRPL